jgi:aspartyl-tRNA(Asn)/glutamyl-tRNA(Gln) amidotransferase subunit C
VYDFAPIFPKLLAHTIMSLTRRDVDNIAQLARLALTEAEIPVYIDSLSRIIELVSELDHAATGGVTPMSHPLPGQTQRLRADAVTEVDRHELYQRNAPQAMAGLYLVPKVIE